MKWRASNGSVALRSVVLITAVASAASATTGVFESYIVVNGTFYDMQASTGNPDFVGTNFGTFLATGTLTASGGELKTFKNGGGNVTGAELNYRAYISGSPAFTSINLPFNADLANPGDQRWQATGQTGNVISKTFSVGNYTYEAYGRAFTNEGDRFSNNGGANYKASFSIRATDFAWSSSPADGTLGANGEGASSSNWVGGVRPGQGHNLLFGSSSVTTLTNGFTSANSITFNSGASAFTIGGAGLNLGNAAAFASAGGSPAVGVFNNSSNAQTINASLTLTNAATLNAASGSLLVGGVATGSNDLTLAGSNNLSVLAINGAGNVVKNGSGIATLSGASNYSGSTTVTNGTLSLATTASITGTSSVSVQSGATLQVDGSVTSAVTVNGTLKGNGTVVGNTTIASGATLSPGASAGKLSITGNLALGDTASTSMEITGTPRGVGGYDAVDVSGSLAYEGALNIPVTGTYTAGTSFNLFDFASQSGNFDSITLTGAYAGSLVHSAGTWSNTLSGMVFTFTNSTGVLSLSAQAVPEPLTAAGVLLLTGRVLGRRHRASL